MADEYADLAALKGHLNIPADDTTRDQLLQRALAAASRGIDRDTGRRFWLDEVPVARVYSSQGRTVFADDGRARLIVNDIGDDTGLVVDTGSGTSWSELPDVETGPDNALLDGRPVTSLIASSWPGRVRVTARWGWPAVPDEVEQATLIQAARLYRRKDSPEGVTGSAEWGVMRLSRVDPDVYALIKHFVLPGFG